jgi:hypothetical protein
MRKRGRCAMRLGRYRAVFGAELTKFVAVIDRATAMATGLGSDTVTYATPNPPLPVYKGLITNATTAQAEMKTRAVGTRATRDVQVGLLIGGMESQRLYVQSLADANQSRAVEIIENAGLVVAASPTHTKLLLALRNSPQSGSVVCDANVGMLIGTGAPHPYAARFFGWQYTIDGSKTFVTAPTTAHGKTVISGLTPSTVVGVRVNITILGVTSAWSDVATILVR